MASFYLDQLKAVQNDPSNALALSESTRVLCLGALIPAENRYNWTQDLAELDDTEWSEAEWFLKYAILELTGEVIDGGYAADFVLDGGTA